MRESPSHPGDGHRLRRTPGGQAESVHGSAGARGLDWPVESGKRQADVGRGGGEIGKDSVAYPGAQRANHVCFSGTGWIGWLRTSC
jgi:hypothetical protein